MNRHPSRFRATPLAALLLAAAPAALAQYAPAYPPDSYFYGPKVYGTRMFDITAFAGYQLNGDVGTYGGNVNIADAPAFGAALDYRVNNFSSIELAWIYDKPDATFISYGTSLYPSSKPFSAASHYFQIGGMTLQRMGRLEPFLGLTIGALLLDPDTITLTSGGTLNASDSWHFASTAMIGTKVWMSDNVGLRLEARMLVPIVFTSGGWYAGTGGSGMAVSGGVPSLQFAFTGGLVFGK